MTAGAGVGTTPRLKRKMGERMHEHGRIYRTNKRTNIDRLKDYRTNESSIDLATATHIYTYTCTHTYIYTETRRIQRKEEGKIDRMIPKNEPR